MKPNTLPLAACQSGPSSANAPFGWAHPSSSWVRASFTDRPQSRFGYFRSSRPPPEKEPDPWAVWKTPARWRAQPGLGILNWPTSPWNTAFAPNAQRPSAWRLPIAIRPTPLATPRFAGTLALLATEWADGVTENERKAYQLVSLLMALRLQVPRLLIADDVGIGKRIEAGLILRELMDREEVDGFFSALPAPPRRAT